MKKIHAFTLIEVVVTMAISGIVIAACYDCFSIINSQLRISNTINKDINEAMRLDSRLNNDIFFAITIQSGEQSFYMTKMNNQTITYKFTDSCILRIANNFTDTFKMKCYHLAMGLKNDTISDQDKLIDFISFKGIVINDTEKFTYTKQYAADQLMPIELSKNNF